MILPARLPVHLSPTPPIFRDLPAPRSPSPVQEYIAKRSRSRSLSLEITKFTPLPTLTPSEVRRAERRLAKKNKVDLVEIKDRVAEEEKERKPQIPLIDDDPIVERAQSKERPTTRSDKMNKKSSVSRGVSKKSPERTIRVDRSRSSRGRSRSPDRRSRSPVRRGRSRSRSRQSSREGPRYRDWSPPRRDRSTSSDRYGARRGRSRSPERGGRDGLRDFSEDRSVRAQSRDRSIDQPSRRQRGGKGSRDRNVPGEKPIGSAWSDERWSKADTLAPPSTTTRRVRETAPQTQAECDWMSARISRERLPFDWDGAFPYCGNVAKGYTWRSTICRLLPIQPGRELCRGAYFFFLRRGKWSDADRSGTPVTLRMVSLSSDTRTAVSFIRLHPNESRFLLDQSSHPNLPLSLQSSRKLRPRKRRRKISRNHESIESRRSLLPVLSSMRSKLSYTLESSRTVSPLSPSTLNCRIDGEHFRTFAEDEESLD